MKLKRFLVHHNGTLIVVLGLLLAGAVYAPGSGYLYENWSYQCP